MLCWPENKKKIESNLKYYYKCRSDLIFEGGFLFLNHKLIVPKKLRSHMLKLIHDEAHLGIEKCKQRARQIIYWPRMCDDIESYIQNCKVCQTFRVSNQREPFPVPGRPWENISADLFDFRNRSFIAIIDSYSNWLEIEESNDKSAESVINVLKKIFSRLGVPDNLMSDNVPFNSFKLKSFSAEWNFNLKNSSPRYPQSNGLAEKAVSIGKRILKKKFYEGSQNDIFASLLEYRNSPLPAIGYSPAQLMMGRILKTKIPTSLQLLKQTIINPNVITNQIIQNRKFQKYYYDRNSKPLKKLENGENIRIRNNNGIWETGKVEKQFNQRSYIVRDSEGKLLRRNRRFLNSSRIQSEQSPSDDNYESLPNWFSKDMSNDVIPSDCNRVNYENELSNNLNSSLSNANDGLNRTRSGRVIQRPLYLNDYVTN